MGIFTENIKYKYLQSQQSESDFGQGLWICLGRFRTSHITASYIDH